MNKYVIISNASIISVVLFKRQGNTSSMYEMSRVVKLKPYLWTIFINQISNGICVLTCQMEEAKAKSFHILYLTIIYNYLSIMQKER